MPERQTVMITGATGFLARHAVRELEKNGINVVGTTSREHLSTTKSGLVFLKTTDRSMFNERVIEYKPNVIVHMAALSAPKDSDTNPEAETINLGSVENAIEGIINTKKLDTNYDPLFIFYSSVEVHGDGEVGKPITESTPLDASTAYSRLKIAAEKYIENKCLSNNIKFIIIRQGQTIGDGQSTKFLIPKVVEQVGKIIKENGRDGGVGSIETGYVGHKRTLLDVRDSSKALLKLIQSGKYGTYMVCGNESQRLTDVIEIILKIAEIDFKNHIVLNQVGDYPLNQKNRLYSPSKILTDIGWKKEISLEDTLRWTLYQELKRIQVVR